MKKNTPNKVDHLLVEKRCRCGKVRLKVKKTHCKNVLTKCALDSSGRLDMYIFLRRTIRRD